MNEPLPHIEALPPVVDRTKDVRVEIAEALLTVLALGDDRLTTNQRAFTGDMLTAMVPFLSEAFRAEMAETLSERTNVAPSLARALILQPIHIARPLIQRVSDLPDGILIEALTESVEHQRAVAARTGLSERVADALFDHGTPALRASCLMRDEVPLAAHRVEALVELSKSEPSLRMPLLNRLELQPSHGFRMFWWMDATQRARVLARFNLSREPIQDMLAALYVDVFTNPDSDAIARGILALCDRRHRPRNSAGEVVAMPTVEQLFRAFRAKPKDAYCRTAATLVGVSPRTVKRVAFDKGGEPFAVMCKSLGISRKKFSTIMEGADPSVKGVEGPTFDEGRREDLLATFDTIGRDYARTILRYWDWHDAMAGLAEAEAGAKEVRSE